MKSAPLTKETLEMAIEMMAREASPFVEGVEPRSYYLVCHPWWVEYLRSDRRKARRMRRRLGRLLAGRDG